MKKQLIINGLNTEEIDSHLSALGEGWEPVLEQQHATSKSRHAVTGSAMDGNCRTTKTWISAIIQDHENAVRYAKALLREQRTALSQFGDAPDFRQRVNTYMQQFDPQYELGELNEIEYGGDEVPQGVSADQLPKPTKQLTIPEPYQKKMRRS